MTRVKRQDSKPRKGAAAVECALVLPLLFLITFGTIEACSTIFLKESVTIAAYEGARQAIMRRATSEDTIDAVDDILELRGVDVSTLGDDYVSVTPNPTTANLLDPITVTVRAPTNGNTVIPAPNWFSWFSNRQVTATVVMRKEFED